MKLLSSIVSIAVLILFTSGFTTTSRTSKSITAPDSSHTVKTSMQKAHKKSAKKEDIGIGPIKEVKLGPINNKLASKGKNIFNSKCFACHRLDSKLVGPALVPIVKKTNKVYLMNYLLNTGEMQKKDPALKKLIKEYNGIVMPDQNLSKKDARAVLEYLRKKAK